MVSISLQTLKRVMVLVVTRHSTVVLVPYTFRVQSLEEFLNIRFVLSSVDTRDDGCIMEYRPGDDTMPGHSATPQMGPLSQMMDMSPSLRDSRLHASSSFAMMNADSMRRDVLDQMSQQNSMMGGSGLL